MTATNVAVYQLLVKSQSRAAELARELSVAQARVISLEDDLEQALIEIPVLEDDLIAERVKFAKATARLSDEIKWLRRENELLSSRIVWRDAEYAKLHEFVLALLSRIRIRGTRGNYGPKISRRQNCNGAGSVIEQLLERRG